MSVIRWTNSLLRTVYVASDPNLGDWADDAGQGAVANRFPGGFAFGSAAFDTATTKHPTLIVLDSFTGANGKFPRGSLIADAAGNLLGTTEAGGKNRAGTVFEIAKTKHGYASAPTTLASFAGIDGTRPFCSLITDAAGNLFGTTEAGGADGYGTVFEIAKTEHGYASAPITLVSFNNADGADLYGSLVADAAGDLFGTTQRGGGPDGLGAVFEIAKTQGGYAGAPTTLVSFMGFDGESPQGNLITDAAGDLFGTTVAGGADGHGTVFEIAKTQGGYASAPTILVSFTGSDGAGPWGGLISDAAGNLFGTTSNGGANGDGTVFEIAKTQSGYASAPTILVTFTNANGAKPVGSLIADAAGSLFGTTANGGTGGDGTVFEIAKIESGYADAATIVNFTGVDGQSPTGGLIADAAGNLFATTSAGGTDGDGTVFEITHSGFVPPSIPFAPAVPASPASTITHRSPPAGVFVQAMAAMTGCGAEAGLIDARPDNESRQMMLSAPRPALA